jgi:hypothetical protein
MKVPTVGTNVFDVDLAGNSSGSPTMTSAFPVDLGFITRRNGGDGWYFVDRLRGGVSLRSINTTAEASFPTLGKFDYMNGYGSSTTLTAYTGWNFRRAAGFFDVVCYTGDGTSPRSITHNLGIAPELMIVKKRNTGDAWAVGVPEIGATKELWLNATIAAYTDAQTFSSAPTSTVFNIGYNGEVNTSGGTYVAYLFATCAGVSKVGSYTGDGTDGRVINCGFTSGARFVLIKRTNTTGNWSVWDSARGITATSDPLLLLNTEDVEDTSGDYIGPSSSGFTVNATPATNASGSTYIFLAIA